MKVVTAGPVYMDIDAFAGCIAYAELLKLQGYNAVASSTATLNESITQRLRGLGSVSPSAKGDEVILIDVSEPSYLDPIAAEGTVVEVIDHHPGFEQYWQGCIGNKAQIEEVGAACTQVFERWENANLIEKMSAEVAELLAAGILDNTLDFLADITKDRDRQAYKELSSIGHLPDDFARNYFSDVQKSIETNLKDAIKNDAKRFNEPATMPSLFGQLVVWDAESIVNERTDEIAEAMNDLGEEWGVNIISIADASSRFLVSSEAVKKQLMSILNVYFDGSLSSPHKMLLRKEILRQAYDAASILKMSRNLQ